MAQTIYRTNEYLSSMHAEIVNDSSKRDIEVGFGNNHNDYLSLRLRTSTNELIFNRTREYGNRNSLSRTIDRNIPAFGHDETTLP